MRSPHDCLVSPIPVLYFSEGGGWGEGWGAEEGLGQRKVERGRIVKYLSIVLVVGKEIYLCSTDTSFYHPRHDDDGDRDLSYRKVN